MEIINVNSSMLLSKKTIEICYSCNDFSQIIAGQVPVFLVDSKLMDELYPPWKRRGYNLNCMHEQVVSSLDEIILSINDDRHITGEQIDRIIDTAFDNIKECIDTEYFYNPVCGLYLNKIDNNIYEKMCKFNNDLDVKLKNKPAIMLCVKRIQEWSQSGNVFLEDKNDSLSILCAAVWFHEAAHAWLNTKPGIYKTFWGHIVEESLANAYSINTLLKNKDTSDSSFFLKSSYGLQSFPYNAWSFWGGAQSRDNIDLLESIRRWRDIDMRKLLMNKRHRRMLRYRNSNIFDGILEEVDEISNETEWKLRALQIINWYRK